jgi:hypothetical protein
VCGTGWHGVELVSFQPRVAFRSTNSGRAYRKHGTGRVRNQWGPTPTSLPYAGITVNKLTMPRRTDSHCPRNCSLLPCGSFYIFRHFPRAKCDRQSTSMGTPL